MINHVCPRCIICLPIMQCLQNSYRDTLLRHMWMCMYIHKTTEAYIMLKCIKIRSWKKNTPEIPLHWLEMNIYRVKKKLIMDAWLNWQTIYSGG